MALFWFSCLSWSAHVSKLAKLIERLKPIDSTRDGVGEGFLKVAYEVMARKWRPQQFDEVVGQEHVARTLTNAIEADRIAHAYLFVGPRGIGKTSTARVLAKALNCAEGPTTRPCDKCDSCREIMAGKSLDVLEIDAASNTGVDHIRDLRENVRFAAARDRFKVYIIDEVHMLSIAAFNALLKTLEEPPPHVKFIFATTEVHKMPNTILSRCQRFDLRRIQLGDIIAHLGKIAESEAVRISDSALLAIARGAEGGMRDAESALDQLIAFQGKKIEEKDVLAVFGLVSHKTLEALSEAILEGNPAQIIQIVSELDQNGKNMRRLVLELLEYFRNLLVISYAPEDDSVVLLTEIQMENARKQAQKSDAERLLRVIDILVETDERIRFALSQKTLLETALIRASRASSVVSMEDLLKQVAELKKGAGNLQSGESPSDAKKGVSRGSKKKSPLTK